MNSFNKLLAIIFLSAAFACRASAQSAAATDIVGVYSGSYDGPDGATTFTLSLSEQEGGRGNIIGVLTSHPADSPDAAVSTSDLAGFYSAPAHRFQLRSKIDRTVGRGTRPSMLAINGAYDASSGQLSGMLMMSGSRPIKFEATRGGTGPAKTASATTPTASTTPLAAQSAASPQAAGTIDGVYNGTCTPWGQSRTFQLALRTFDNGTLAGIMTLYDPLMSHEHPHSYGLTGTFEPATGKFKLQPPNGLSPAPRYFLLGLTGTVDPNTGQVAGTLINGPHDPFEATRDAAESTNIASLISSPASAMAADSKNPGPKPSNVSGVYTGFVGCAMGGKLNATLSLKGADAPNYGVVTGVLTVDLPADVGSTVTYQLLGKWQLGVVHVDTMRRGAQAPFNYDIQNLTVRNTEGMGAIATHLLGDATARAACEIDVFRDEAQSAKLDDVMAAQIDQATNPETLAKAAAHAKELQAAHEAAAKQQAALIAAAAPKELASKDVVRKSREYWDGFHGDMIREIFDGGFGDGLGDNTEFMLLFTHYCEAFGRDCKDALPAKHETVTITKYRVEKDAFGNVVRSQTLQTWTFECDSRFAPFYKEYSEELKKRAPGMAVSVAAGHGSVGDLMEPVADIERFFATQKCRSAAMHQFTENLLRAAEDKLSLQQAGEKVDGAAAETDPNLPPGKYARFVDGCNGWGRDPKNAYYKTGQSSAWCQCLGDKYHHVMSREEEYYYANDFGPRFRNTISQPHSTDPAWNRLHPAVEDCRQ